MKKMGRPIARLSDFRRPECLLGLASCAMVGLMVFCGGAMLYCKITAPTKTKQVKLKSQVERVLEQYDTNRNGALDKAELRDYPLPVERVLEQYDTNVRDGKLDRQELSNLLDN